MSDDKLTLALRLIANNSVFKSVLGGSQQDVNRFVVKSREQFASLGRAWNSVAGKMAAVGLGFGAFEIVKGSALLERQLNRIALSAGKTKVEAKGLREHLEGLGIKTGQDVGQLANGFEKLFSLTGNWDIAKKSIEAVNTAVTVTGANTDILAESLSVAQTSFGKDLSKKGAPSEVLNKLGAIAPGAGGLSNVAGIFNEIAPMAALAGMDFNSAIAFIGEISEVTKNPGQMGEMANQTLRMFSGLKGLTNKKGSLGQLIFDPKTGEKQNPLVVLSKIKTLYDSLSEKKKVDLMMALGADPKSMKSVQLFLESTALNKGSEFKRKIDSSGNALETKLPAAIDNAADQAARLKNLLTEAGEGLAAPINKALANAIQFAMDKGKLSGLDIAGLGVTAAGTAWLGSNLLKGTIGKFLGGKTSLAGGVAEGGALRQVGVTSVYVVNYGEIGNASAVPMGGKLQEFLPKAAVPAGAGAAGVGAAVASIAVPLVVGSAIGIGIGYGVEKLKERISNPTAHIETGLSRPGENVGGAMAPSSILHRAETNVTLYYNGEMAKPDKTIIDHRGSFEK